MEDNSSEAQRGSDMAVIRIEERSIASAETNAVVRFGDEAQYAITIINPFDEKAEAELEWYFEKHTQFPFTGQVRAQQAAASLLIYGEHLFKQVFANPDAYAAYKERMKRGLSELQFEVVGSPAFQALHWEALKDPQLVDPLALSANLVRRYLGHQPLPATVRAAPTVRMLLYQLAPYDTIEKGAAL